MEKQNEFLTIDELADMLKISTRTIRRILKRGDLPAMRIGRQLRFNREAVNEWLKTQSIEQSEGQNTA
ncbi:helix-turn-helix domain-containing protein [Candidatus Sumerlaeota bacterium]|nr:helix-turn-helix domain-containing protein [Candidatus Sumerlaeota bacterium]